MDAADVEALSESAVEELADVVHYAYLNESLTSRGWGDNIARAILASRWLADLLAATRAEALREAGVKVGRMRHGVSGRRVPNAEWLGEVVYAMGDELEYQAERADREAVDSSTRAAP